MSNVSRTSKITTSISRAATEPTKVELSKVWYQSHAVGSIMHYKHYIPMAFEDHTVLYDDIPMDAGATPTMMTVMGNLYSSNHFNPWNE